MITIENIKELQQRVQILGRCIAVDDKRAEVEEKTQKKRTFTVPFLMYNYIENYWLKKSIK